MILTYPNGQKVVFNRRIKTKDGLVQGVRMIPVVDERSMHARDASNTVTVNEYRESLGHPNMVVTKSTAKARDVELVGDTLMCKDCGIGKAHRKSLSREPSSAPKIQAIVSSWT